uniref:Egg protein CP391S-like protein n=1 Tax=Schistosoma mansoni TaxID=6183 RepID=A0AA82N8F8_SCHMA
MRYTFSSDYLMLVYLVISLTLKFFNCQHVCDEIDSLTKGKLVFENESYAYSQYYHYSQIIRVNQSSPIVDCKFEKFVPPRKIIPKFLFQFYGSDVSRFDIGYYGITFMNGSKELGSISSYSSDIYSPQYEFSNEENLLAHRLSFQNKGDSLKRTFKITHLILPNGKISVYYDNMTQEFGLQFQSRLSGSLACERGERKLHTFVVKKWIKSGTLVEYEVSGDCPKHDSMEICQESKTSNTKCMWYEKANMCIVSTDKDIDDFKVNSCQIGNSSNVHVSITPIVVEEATTTPRISESDNGHGKSNHFLHIVIPVVICFLVVCSGCVICLWLYRKKKCMPSLS